MSLREFNVASDYLPQKALDEIEKLLDRLPREIDLTSIQAHTDSITVTIKFPVVGPLAQDQALTDLINAAMCIETLLLNLREARELI